MRVRAIKAAGSKGREMGGIMKFEGKNGFYKFNVI
jgi:hypothetical protein